MATAAQAAELRAKLTAHIAARFGGTGESAWQRAFQAHDTDRDGVIGASELSALLDDAGIGNFLTLSSWVDGVLSELDKDRSHAISYSELLQALRSSSSASPVYAEAKEAVARPDYLFPLNYTPSSPAPAAKAKAKAPKSSAPSSELSPLVFGAFAIGLLFLIRRH